MDDLRPEVAVSAPPLRRVSEQTARPWARELELAAFELRLPDDRFEVAQQLKVVRARALGRGAYGGFLQQPAVHLLGDVERAFGVAQARGADPEDPEKRQRRERHQ